MARLADREPDALADVYERFGRVTFGFLLKTLGDRATAEDVHQQVYLEVWQRAPTYDPARSRFLNWVMTIAPPSPRSSIAGRAASMVK